MITRAAFELTAEERGKTITRLIESSYPGSLFFIMLVVSAIIAAIGLILNNASIVIGSMLVAPFLSPVLSLSMGIVLADFELIKRSIVIISKATGISIFVAAIFAMFIFVPRGYNSEILSRALPSLPYLYIAIAAGVAAAFSVAKPYIAEFIVGVAVSVALLPPLAVSGIGISEFDAIVALGAFQLYVVNLIGIIFAGVVIFSLMGFYPVRKQAEKAIKVEEEKLEHEKEEGQEVKKQHSKASDIHKP
ncbi:MAG: TIGR00341 family protein [Candidatus Sungbacteria bacterium RIFCSPLOWO2_01_FULL_47_10]|uniref:TIGR00341 family protein n=1 Tax=Candidatus Sungbacteria bacterium RIFCSPLOWO2_01_FULL_47_10 TaxID=1802276 RepID=A0A1G2L378_9BACT|nr:MAG: TIGR00341 family protein [Candidatus Sungbacteria bacterium RIFCSPLOWO2_01_FULL_47_10]